MKENIITINSFPLLLKEIYKPPNQLFYKGKLKTLNKTCIAVVGTRKLSEYGEYITNKIIEELSVLDIAIVSGLAKGIDTIAHKAALENNIPTIAVLGSGLDNIYPKQNLKLAKKIILNGILLSEYEPNKDP
ncbi:DNA-protecting protein DprA, partial [Candidatus Peregrinibacteria bacterium]|nr:DNA-protecting protein DprA [Candidatus Peregrinibacteria bacterium]